MAVVQYIFKNKPYIEKHNREKNTWKNTIHRKHNRKKQYIEKHNSLRKNSADRARFYELYTVICLATEEETRKTVRQRGRRVRDGKMKTEYTEQNIHNNKNI